MKKNLSINRIFNIENGIIIVLILSLIVVFSLEIAQTKVEAREISKEALNNDNTAIPEENNKDTEEPINENLIEKIPTEEPIDSIIEEIDPNYSVPTQYPESDSNDWTLPSNNNIGNNNNNSTPQVIQPPVVEHPVVETPVVEPPVVETPVVKPPVVETPVVKPPVVKPPVVETPVIEPPIVKPPVVESPIIE